MRKKTILVTGANGQLGQELQKIATEYDAQFKFVFVDKDTLALGEKVQKMNRFFNLKKADYCINTAAYTAVDQAEEEKFLSFSANSLGPEFLAKVCKKKKVKLIHISTDYVFDGESKIPYKEEDATNPINYYGFTKNEGDKKVLEIDRNAIIIRTSWLYSEYGHNFVKTMIRLMGEKEHINVVNDQIGSPTYANTLANIIMQFILQTEQNKFFRGIYHYSSESAISWYDFAIAVKEMIGSNCIVHPVSTAKYPTKAKRSSYSVLDKTKIKSELGIHLPNWKEELKECIGKLKSKSQKTGN